MKRGKEGQSRQSVARLFGALLCLVLSGGVTVVGVASPVARFVRSAPSESNPLEVTFDASSSHSAAGPILTYQWSFGDGHSGSGQTIVHQYAQDGSYLVTLVVSDAKTPPAMAQGLIHVSGPGEVFALGTAVGQAAPTFELPDLKGTVLRPADLRGKVVLLDFWATWCPACTKTLPLLEDLRVRYQDRGLVVVGVTTDKKAGDAASYLAKSGYSGFITLWGSLDAARGVQAQFGVGGIPHIFVIDRIGVIRFSGRPDDLGAADVEPWL